MFRPYRYGCENAAVYHRPRTGNDRPDYPEYLCEECYEAMFDKQKRQNGFWRKGKESNPDREVNGDV